MGSLDLALADDQLLAEQGILCDQLGAGPREVGGGTEEEGCASGLREMTEGVIQQREELGKDAGW